MDPRLLYAVGRAIELGADLVVHEEDRPLLASLLELGGDTAVHTQIRLRAVHRFAGAAESKASEPSDSQPSADTECK